MMTGTLTWAVVNPRAPAGGFFEGLVVLIPALLAETARCKSGRLGR